LEQKPPCSKIFALTAEVKVALVVDGIGMEKANEHG